MFARTPFMRLTMIACFILFTILLPSTLGCGQKKDFCFYIRKGMTVDPSAYHVGPDSNGNLEYHPYQDNKDHDIDGCGGDSGAYYDNRGDTIQVGAYDGMQMRIGVGGKWRDGVYDFKPGEYPSVYFQCGRPPKAEDEEVVKGEQKEREEVAQEQH